MWLVTKNIVLNDSSDGRQGMWKIRENYIKCHENCQMNSYTAAVLYEWSTEESNRDSNNTGGQETWV